MARRPLKEVVALSAGPILDPLRLLFRCRPLGLAVGARRERAEQVAGAGRCFRLGLKYVVVFEPAGS